MRLRCPAAFVCSVVLLCGCVADREQANLVATVPIAGTVGTAAHLADCIETDLDAASGIPESDKADLRARADVLRSHAEKVGLAVKLCDPSGKTNPSITLNNLRARSEALDEEYRLAFREWGVWQVRHGLKKPEEIFEVFDYDAAME